MFTEVQIGDYAMEFPELTLVKYAQIFSKLLKIRWLVSQHLNSIFMYTRSANYLIHKVVIEINLCLSINLIFIVVYQVTHHLGEEPISRTRWHRQSRNPNRFKRVQFAHCPPPGKSRNTRKVALHIFCPELLHISSNIVVI